MDLYFIRHASAVELDHEISEDSFRYLSPEGRAHSAEIAQKLHKLNINFDLILSSPRETSQVTLKHLENKIDQVNK